MKARRPGSSAGKQSGKWQQAYRKALRQFGHKAQAERIAWAAIDAAPKRKVRVGKRAA